MGRPVEGALLLGVAGELDVRWAAVDVTPAVEEARRRHDLSPIAATALGRSFSAAALVHALATRACRRLTLTVSGDGPLGRVLAEIDDAGNLRGLVASPHVDLPVREDGKLPIGEAVGRGHLSVVRELADGSLSESRVALATGEIGLDVAHYLEQSEQTQSAVLVGVLAAPEGIRAAGGIVAEVIPGASDATLSTLESNLSELGSFSRRMEELGLEALVESLFTGLALEPRERRGIRFRCRCNRAALLPRLAGLGESDLAEIASADGSVAAQCAFCGATYLFAASELAAARSSSLR